MNKITKKDKVDFLYDIGVSAKGKKLSKRELQKISDKVLNDVFEKFRATHDFEAWKNRPKLSTFYVECESGVIFQVKAINDEEAEKRITEDGEKVVRVVAKKGHYICPYCNGLAEGFDSHMLCEECRMLFGHMYIDEL